MFVTTQRTSQSTIVYEVLDFAVGLTDADGDLITQGNGVTLFLGDARRGRPQRARRNSATRSPRATSSSPTTRTRWRDASLRRDAGDARLRRGRARRVRRQQGALDRGRRHGPGQRADGHDRDLPGGPPASRASSSSTVACRTTRSRRHQRQRSPAGDDHRRPARPGGVGTARRAAIRRALRPATDRARQDAVERTLEHSAELAYDSSSRSCRLACTRRRTGSITDRRRRAIRDFG